MLGEELTLNRNVCKETGRAYRSRGVCRVLVGRPEGNGPLGRPDGRIILKWTLNKWDGEAWTGLIWPTTGTGGRRL
jgi:hypothetical protein